MCLSLVYPSTTHYRSLSHGTCLQTRIKCCRINTTHHRGRRLRASAGPCSACQPRSPQPRLRPLPAAQAARCRRALAAAGPLPPPAAAAVPHKLLGTLMHIGWLNSAAYQECSRPTYQETLAAYQEMPGPPQGAELSLLPPRLPLLVHTGLRRRIPRRPAGAPATSPGAKWSNGPFRRGRVPLRRRSHPPAPGQMVKWCSRPPSGGAFASEPSSPPNAHVTAPRDRGHVTPAAPGCGGGWVGRESAGARPDPPHPPSPHAAPPNPNPHPAPSAPSRHGGGAGGWIGSRGCAGRRWRRRPPPSPGFHPPEGIYIILISHSLITITSRLIFSYSLSNQTKARSMSKLELFLFHKCKILTTTLFLFKVLSQKILKICQM